MTTYSYSPLKDIESLRERRERVRELLQKTWEPTRLIAEKTSYSIEEVTRIGHNYGIKMRKRHLAIMEHDKSVRLEHEAKEAKANSIRMFREATKGADAF